MTFLQNKDYLIDTHCHLNSEIYDENRASVVSNSKTGGVMEIFDVSVTINSSRKSLDVARSFPEVKSFVGIDPEVFIPNSEMFVGFDVGESWFEEQYALLDVLISANRDHIVGIGETGMDYYWFIHEHPDDQELSKEMQQRLFEIHAELAQKYSLPLTVHSRNAELPCLHVLENYDVEAIFHSYTGNLEVAEKIVSAGHGLGINGIVTFKNGEALRELYKTLLKGKSISTPQDLYKNQLFLETDGPYLSPEGKRGTRNEPANIAIIWERFLEEMGM